MGGEQRPRRHRGHAGHREDRDPARSGYAPVRPQRRRWRREHDREPRSAQARRRSGDGDGRASRVFGGRRRRRRRGPERKRRQVCVAPQGLRVHRGDTAIPGFAESAQVREAEADDEEEDPEEDAFGFIPNSQVEYTGFSAGGSWIDDDFYLGLAVADFQTNYGVVFHELEGHSHAAPGEEEPPISIDLDTKSLDVAGGLVAPIEGIRSVDARLRLTDYHHDEVGGGVVATTFENKGYDLRIEAVHEPFGLFEGAFGFQSAFSDFQVSGEEGFLPNTFSARQSLFVIEEVDLDPVTLELGGRFDYATVDSGGGGVFGDAVERDFPGGAASVGVVYDVVKDQILSFDVSWSMRPPNYEELFADGIHVGSGFYEIGDPDLDSENALGLNLGYAGQFSIFDWSANALYDRFWGFTFLQGTGETIGVVPVGRFFSTDA
ncbi:MAG: TonB-dependent receptor, partial [Deltaproteobacteria bacterium]|nr:TonB-dependent receptor [Deltaproteobacteria bacterium]